MGSSAIPVKPFKLRCDEPIISFTFDDCPKTAAIAGAEILNRYDAAGTYYICGGLTDQYEQDMLCHSQSDLLALIEDGHEIASHLYHHKNCIDLTDAELKTEIAENDTFFADLQYDRTLVNFAYPFGGTKLSARKIASSHYATARGIRPGLNSGVVDFSNLYANSIYSKNTTEADILDVIQSTVDKCAWSIFYTHDVAEMPSEWGTTPELLEYAVAKATEMNCRILPVRNAIGAIGFHG